MRSLIIILLSLTFAMAKGQSIVGTWQLTDEKPCIEQQIEESDTEKELLKSFGSSSSAVAKIIKFGPKGTGEEGIFSTGKKKGSNRESFRYRVQGNELQFLDKKSGMITERFTIDELTSSTMRFHRVGRDCEVRSFSRIK